MHNRHANIGKLLAVSYSIMQFLLYQQFRCVNVNKVFSFSVPCLAEVFPPSKEKEKKPLHGSA